MTTFGTVLLVLGVILLALFDQYYVRYFLRLSKWKKGEPLETK